MGLKSKRWENSKTAMGFPGVNRRGVDPRRETKIASLVFQRMRGSALALPWYFPPRDEVLRENSTQKGRR